MMSAQKYSVTQHTIGTIISWIQEGLIAIPEIQRPYVWTPTKVRDFLDSLFQGFPVGYLIAWRNKNVKLKDGSIAEGRRILIDGQQRVGALMAALLGYQVVTKDYRHTHIRIAYNPATREFKVSDAATRRDKAWVPDIVAVFDPKASLFNMVNTYCANNPGTTQDDIFRSFEQLHKITNNLIGLIELDPDLDIETVTKIFIRVNSEGVPLNQADFAMSKIAANERYGGPMLRKTIDYFCHLAVRPAFYSKIQENDREFASTEYFSKMSWLKTENDDLYDPSYTDMLRVAFTSEFRRGRLQDLVALLSGRNFETREYEDAIVEDTFSRLNTGIMNFMNENHFKRFIMIIRSAGFVDSALIGSQNALNFAYILYLTLRNQGVSNADIEHQVRRWYVMSMLTSRYTGPTETTFDTDIRQINEQGIEAYSAPVYAGQLSEAFWDTALPQSLNTASSNSPFFRVFRAAQVKLGDLGFLSRDITVRELVEVKSDVHHIFPRAYLRQHGLTRGQYNQVANFAVMQSEINIAIGSKEPWVYFTEVFEQCNGGPKKYGNIVDPDALRANLEMHCIPEGVENMTVDDYPDFLAQRRWLMAQRIKTYFESL